MLQKQPVLEATAKVWRHITSRRISALTTVTRRGRLRCAFTSKLMRKRALIILLALERMQPVENHRELACLMLITIAVRDVLKMIALKNKFGPMYSQFTILQWKSMDGTEMEEPLHDDDKPAHILKLWRAKGETDATRRFFVYFCDNVAEGLPRPTPFKLGDESSVSSGGTGANNNDVDEDEESGNEPASLSAFALGSLKRVKARTRCC
jgi:hypothetical protein